MGLNQRGALKRGNRVYILKKKVKVLDVEIVQQMKNKCLEEKYTIRTKLITFVIFPLLLVSNVGVGGCPV